MYVYDGKRLAHIEMYSYTLIGTEWGWNWDNDWSADLFEYMDIVPLDEMPPFDPAKQAYIVPDVQAVIDCAIECEEGIPDCCAIITECNPITGYMLPETRFITAFP